MRGDIILVGEEHRRAAGLVDEDLIDEIRSADRRVTMTVAGSGKSETGKALANALEERGREDFDPFIEEVLEIEHDIISRHRARADVVITREYDVEFVGG